MTRAVYLGPWRIDVTVREGIRVPVPTVHLARSIRAALEAACAPSPASIGLILGDDRELAALNAEHMGHRGPTDVLSFPLLPPEAFPTHEGQATAGVPGPRPTAGLPGPRPTASMPGPRPAANVPGPRPTAPTFSLPPGRRPHLGDIVVSVERAIEQAGAGRGGQTGDIRWSPADELRLLVTHGTLHVCGWDHAEPAEEAAMRALEARLLARSIDSTR